MSPNWLRPDGRSPCTAAKYNLRSLASAQPDGTVTYGLVYTKGSGATPAWRSPGAFERDGAHDVLGRAPGDEPGAAAPAPEDERQGLQPERGQAGEEGEGKLGEPRPLGEQEQARGARAEHRSGALAGAFAQPLEN